MQIRIRHQNTKLIKLNNIYNEPTFNFFYFCPYWDNAALQISKSSLPNNICDKLSPYT